MVTDNERICELPVKKCKKCKNLPNTGLQCINCGTLMHPGCLKYYNDIEKLNEKYIKCCELRVSEDNLENQEGGSLNCSMESVIEINETPRNKTNEDIIKQLTYENEKLSNEIALLRKLVSEMDDKNSLLLSKINILEKDSNKGVRRNKLYENDIIEPNREPDDKISGMSDKNMIKSHEIKAGQQTLHKREDKFIATSTGTAGKPNNNNDHLRGKAKETARKNDSNRKVLKGTHTTEIQGGFSSIQQKVWIHIGKIKPDTSEEEIKTHLNEIFPGRSFVVEALPVRSNARSMSFRVGGDMDLKDSLYDAKNWPIGVTIRRFKFFRDHNTVAASFNVEKKILDGR